MSPDRCYGFVCFFALDSGGQKFFGFSEYLAGLALMVLAWTIADVRYRFRIRTAPLPLQGLTFTVVAVIGVLALLTDLWRAERWLVPHGNLLTPGSWQALLGSVFLLNFLVWAWFAFIRPPTYGRRNAGRFAQTLYRSVLKGSPDELAIVADELTYSIRSIVQNASDASALEFRQTRANHKNWPMPNVEAYANDLLLLIADKKLCRVIVASSPITALAVFQEIGSAKKFDVQIGAFAKNIMNAGIENRDSFLFHESDRFDSGLIGRHKPLSQAMFSNYAMVETIGTMLDPAFPSSSKWDAGQWEAYCRAVLIVFKAYLDEGHGGHSFVLYRSIGEIERIVSDVYTLDGVTNVSWDNDALARLRIAVEFVIDAVGLLDDKGVPDRLRLRRREKNHPMLEGFYDHVAKMIFEIVFAASAVKSPKWECWHVQHNMVWGEFFQSERMRSRAGQVVRFKARRLLYEEILRMAEFPNFKGARVLGICLNVMGLTVGKGTFNRESRALQKAVLAWTRRNFAGLYAYNSRVGEACLVDGITYDAEELRIVKTAPMEGLRREPWYEYLSLEPGPPQGELR